MAHFKKPWQYLIHFPKVIWAFVAERPTCLLSTGSGRLGLVPFLIARLTGVKFIHIETFSHVHRLTKMGRIVRFFGQPVYSQWESPSKKVIYLGPIINNSPYVERAIIRQNHIFVTAGTRYEPFPRLLKAVEDLKRSGIIKQRVIVQAGYTKYDSEFMEIFGFCPPQEIDRLIAGALFVITQESAGIATKCLKSSTRFLVLPRSFSQGELPARSDMNEDLHLRLAEMGFTEVVHTSKEMEAAIGRIDKLKTGFPFDNSRALTVLRSLIDSGT